jgi:hypothetical protein
MLLAVLHRHAGVVCFDQDVFVNAVGGVKIAEPRRRSCGAAGDCLFAHQRPPRELVVFGEVGLAGEIRPAPAARSVSRSRPSSVFTLALVPKANAPKHDIPGMRVLAVDRIDEAPRTPARAGNSLKRRYCTAASLKSTENVEIRATAGKERGKLSACGWCGAQQATGTRRHLLRLLCIHPFLSLHTKSYE